VSFVNIGQGNEIAGADRLLGDAGDLDGPALAVVAVHLVNGLAQHLVGGGRPGLRRVVLRDDVGEVEIRLQQAELGDEAGVFDAVRQGVVGADFGDKPLLEGPRQCLFGAFA